MLSFLIHGDSSKPVTGLKAFAKEEDAAAFLKENGGSVVNFEEAIDDTYDEMWNDIKMIREKRAKMKKMKGMKK